MRPALGESDERRPAGGLSNPARVESELAVSFPDGVW